MSASRFATLAICVLVACQQGSQPAPIDTRARARRCPTHLDMELIGAQSRFDPGSSGLAHGVGLANGSQINVEVVDCDDECRRCSFRGPVRGDPALTPVISQRCLNNVATVCTSNADCGTKGPCRFIFPPITARVALQTCTLAYFEPVTGADTSPIQGVVDLDTGESDLALMNLRIAISLDKVTGAPDGACTNCLGDSQPFDGERTGHCEFGGQACDVDGIGTVISSTTSYDCAPPPTTINVPLPVNGTSTASREWTMDATRPKCTKNGGVTTEPCWCGACSDGSACQSNKDCANGSACGFAGTVASPVTVQNNKCTNGACVWDDATSKGHCANDASISCFPGGTLGATMIARGSAEVQGDGVYIQELSNLVCVPVTDRGFVDAIAGFPGPFLFQARFRVTTRGER